MTTFTYDKTAPTELCVAYIALLDDDPDEPILVIKNTGNDRHTYIYSDGSIATQTMNCEDEAIHKFYPGDSVTITF